MPPVQALALQRLALCLNQGGKFESFQFSGDSLRLASGEAGGKMLAARVQDSGTCGWLAVLPLSEVTCDRSLPGIERACRGGDRSASKDELYSEGLSQTCGALALAVVAIASDRLSHALLWANVAPCCRTQASHS